MLLTIVVGYLVIAFALGLFWIKAIQSGWEGWIIGLMWFPILVQYVYRRTVRKLKNAYTGQ